MKVNISFAWFANTQNVCEQSSFGRFRLESAVKDDNTFASDFMS